MLEALALIPFAIIGLIILVVIFFALWPLWLVIGITLFIAVQSGAPIA